MISVKKLSKIKIDLTPLEPLARAVLGERYELSVVFCTTELSQKLNRVYRGKNNPTNVLSFPLTKDTGELFINLPLARTEAKKIGLTFDDWVVKLFIHGLLHLDGMTHGSKMESKEKNFLTYWTNEKHRYRLGHRHIGHPRRRR